MKAFVLAILTTLLAALPLSAEASADHSATSVAAVTSAGSTVPAASPAVLAAFEEKVAGAAPAVGNPEGSPPPSTLSPEEDDQAGLLPGPPGSFFDGRRILAFYGRPGSTGMGILGEYPKDALSDLLFGYARLYDEAGGGTGVIPAFYIVYGACWPGGAIGLLRDAVVREWIEYAASRGILVFLDHQIGRFGVDAAMDRLLPWLEWPNVHLALDPEWSTSDPMKTIGTISAEDLNLAQARMAEWLALRGDASERFLVVHQFTAKMISGREKVRADFPGVRLVHSSDGFGNPLMKRKTYAWNALASNMPRKGFKLFMKTDVRGAGWDDPLLSPTEVLSLDPCPELVIYQ